MVAKSDGMIRTQIQLEEQQYKQLRSLGARTGKGLARQVREAVGQYLVQQQRGGAALDEVLGKFRASPAKGLKPHDRDYADTLR